MVSNVNQKNLKNTIRRDPLDYLLSARELASRTKDGALGTRNNPYLLEDQHKTLQENVLHAPSNIRVKNNTGSTIPLLKVVKFTGVDTATKYPLIVPISSPTDLPNGVVREGDILAGRAGFISSDNLISNVDTSSFSAGTLLYSDSIGNLTATVTDIFVGKVLVSDVSSGVLYVKPSRIATGSSSGNLTSQVFTGVATVANIATVLAVNSLTSIATIEVIDSLSRVITEGVCIEAITSPLSVRITANANLTNLKVVVSGDV